jgi:membrane protein DedA with SNARE-associated domain
MADFLRQILDALKQIPNIIGVFDLRVVLLLFILCLCGEILLAAVPYLLETVWLLAGYNLSIGILSPFHLLLLWLVALAGRETGVLLLFSASRFGSLPLTRIYQKYVGARVKKFSGNDNWFSKVLKKLESYISPFTIALGRLLGLGTPLTVLLGVKKQYRVLFLGVIISSIIFDGIFLTVGIVVGANTMVKPAEMVLFSLAGLTVFYLIVFSIRQISNRMKARQARNNQPK